MQRFVELIKQLAPMLELSDVEFEENNDFNLVIDSMFVTFRFVEAYDQLVLLSPLVELSEKTTEALSELLEGNFLYAATAGCTLAMHDKLVTLQAVYPMEGVNPTTLFKDLERFVHIHDYWMNQLANKTTATETFSDDATTNAQQTSLTGALPPDLTAMV